MDHDRWRRLEAIQHAQRMAQQVRFDQQQQAMLQMQRSADSNGSNSNLHSMNFGNLTSGLSPDQYHASGQAPMTQAPMEMDHQLRQQAGLHAPRMGAPGPAGQMPHPNGFNADPNGFQSAMNPYAFSTNFGGNESITRGGASLYGSNGNIWGGAPSAYGGESSMHSASPSMGGSSSNSYGSNAGVHGSNASVSSMYGNNPGMYDGNSSIYGSNPGTQGSAADIWHSAPGAHSGNPSAFGSSATLSGSDMSEYGRLFVGYQGRSRKIGGQKRQRHEQQDQHDIGKRSREHDLVQQREDQQRQAERTQKQREAINRMVDGKTASIDDIDDPVIHQMLRALPPGPPTHSERLGTQESDDRADRAARACNYQPPELDKKVKRWPRPLQPAWYDVGLNYYNQDVVGPMPYSHLPRSRPIPANPAHKRFLLDRIGCAQIGCRVMRAQRWCAERGVEGKEEFMPLTADETFYGIASKLLLQWLDEAFTENVRYTVIATCLDDETNSMVDRTELATVGDVV